MRALRIGSRGSKLALWQANHIADRLGKLGTVPAEIVVIKTAGDRFQQAQIAQMGMKGIFIKELEDALLEKRIDLAVHSMKDVPTQIPAGLAFAAVCERDDVRDCLISRENSALRDLPAGARVGTSSLRRQSQLRYFRPDLELRELRGNVDTRLRKLEQGEFDAVVLAKAGMDRLGWSDKISEIIPTEICLPAAGQGALGIECRAGDRELFDLLSHLDHPETRVCISAERALLDEMQGGCQVPLGVLGRIQNGRLRLEARVLSADGVDAVGGSLEGAADQGDSLGRELARSLLDAGADRILKQAGRAIGTA